MNEDQREKKMQLLKNQAKLLRQSFDTVQIFVTKEDVEEEETGAYCWGEGNWFARFGQVIDWVKKENTDE